VAAASSGDVSVAQSAYNAGFRGPALALATAVALAENRGSPNPRATNLSDPAGGSYGTWQINGVHAPGGNATSAAAQQAGWINSMYDQDTNASEAYSLSGQGTNFRPWLADFIGTGSANYSAYLNRAIAAAQSVSGTTITASQVNSLAVASSGGATAGAAAGSAGPVGPTSTTSNSGTAGSTCIITLPLVGCILTRSQLKAVAGGASVAAGGLLGVVSVVLAVALSKGTQVSGVAQAAQVVRGAPQRSRERTATKAKTKASTAENRERERTAPARADAATKTATERANAARARTRQERARARQEESAAAVLKSSGSAAGGTSRAARSHERSNQADMARRYKASQKTIDVPRGGTGIRPTHRNGRPSIPADEPPF
jgi:hypothetical protein